MRRTKTLDLVDVLFEIQRLARVLKPLIEEGSDEFDEFGKALTYILDNIFPTYSVAFVGPVNSGKSTLLSSLLQESGDHPIASISPSNETFAPMVISYSQTPSLMVRYFGMDVLRDIVNHLADLQRSGENKHEVAQYKEIRNTLRRIEPVVASDLKEGILRKIDLSNKRRQEIIRTVKKYIAQSSGNPDVYGVYKVELTYPGKVLQRLNHVRFIDLFGFGEPNPLINMKYTRFVSSENLDAIVYVFPDRSISDDFYHLFDIPGFLEEIVEKKRLFLVLNKADAYTDITSPSGWPRIEADFRKNLVRLVPVLRRYADAIPIFVLSAASIDGNISHKKTASIKRASIRNLQSLRNQLRHLANETESTASDVSIYLTSIFDLLEILDLFAIGAKETLNKIEKRVPEIAALLDSVSRNETFFSQQKDALLGTFRASLQNIVEENLMRIDYKGMVRFPGSLSLRNPAALFREMVDISHQLVVTAYDQVLEQIFTDVIRFVDEHLIAAYREYVDRQDTIIQSEIQKLQLESPRIRPLRSTVDYGARDLLHFSKKPSLHHVNKELLSRFSFWFLRNRCEFDASRDKGIEDVRTQIMENVRKTIETFMLVYVCEEPKQKSSYLRHICTAGEPTFWEQLTHHIEKLGDVLTNQVRITKWKFGLYQNQVFFVSHKREFHEYTVKLLEQKEKAQKIVLELV